MQLLRPAVVADAAFLAALRTHPEVAPYLGLREGSEEALRAELLDADPASAGRFVIVGGGSDAGPLAFERAGFVREGVHRRASWRRGAWQDGVLLGRLPTDAVPPPRGVGP